MNRRAPTVVPRSMQGTSPTLSGAIAVLIGALGASVLLLADRQTSRRTALPRLPPTRIEWETNFECSLSVEIALDRDQPGTLLRVAGQVTTLDALRTRLRTFAERRLTPTRESLVTVTLACDQDVQFEAIRAVLDACRQAMIHRIWMIGEEDRRPDQIAVRPMWIARADPPEAPIVIAVGTGGSILVDGCRVGRPSEVVTTLRDSKVDPWREIWVRAQDDARWEDVARTICFARQTWRHASVSVSLEE